MNNIRPVSDLRNKYPEIEEALKTLGVIYLTKNGYGNAVLLDIEKYEELTGESSPVAEAKFKPTAKASEFRGILHKYANPDLIKYEKYAGRMHVMKKYGMDVSWEDIIKAEEVSEDDE